jgi:hypothetical protein
MAGEYRGGCTKGMRAGTDTTPGCSRSCGHRRLVEGYRDARFAWEALRESGTPVMPPTGGAGAVTAPSRMDEEEFRDQFPPPTFKEWLIDNRAPREP